MPNKPNEREYRSFNSYELKRSINRSEDESESFIVEGYASTFEAYTLYENSYEEWREVIAPDAFNNADMSDVVFLRDHEGQVFARTKNNTIAIIPDEKGLFTRTNLNSTASSRAMYEDIEAGLYEQMSFAFIVGEQHFEERMEGEKTIVTRYIDTIKKVFDISAVAFPANPTTNIGISTRAIFDGAIEELRAERLEEKRAKNEVERQKAIAKLKLSKGE